MLRKKGKDLVGKMKVGETGKREGFCSGKTVGGDLPKREEWW